MHAKICTHYQIDTNNLHNFNKISFGIHDLIQYYIVQKHSNINKLEKKVKYKHCNIIAMGIIFI